MKTQRQTEPEIVKSLRNGHSSARFKDKRNNPKKEKTSVKT